MAIFLKRATWEVLCNKYELEVCFIKNMAQRKGRFCSWVFVIFLCQARYLPMCLQCVYSCVWRNRRSTVRSQFYSARSTLRLLSISSGWATPITQFLNLSFTTLWLFSWSACFKVSAMWVWVSLFVKSWKSYKATFLYLASAENNLNQ